MQPKVVWEDRNRLQYPCISSRLLYQRTIYKLSLIMVRTQLALHQRRCPCKLWLEAEGWGA
jgi:hypothetical protein